MVEKRTEKGVEKRTGMDKSSLDPMAGGEDLSAVLMRIACALEVIAAKDKHSADSKNSFDLLESDAFVWEAVTSGLRPVQLVQSLPLHLLQGVGEACDTLLENTLRFSRGFSANNALLWGARGTGKSSIVKAIHRYVNQNPEAGQPPLILVEIQRDDIATVDRLLHLLRGRSERVLLYCDDLSFDRNDDSYKSLKAILDGGIEGRPENVLFYATSNRRHLLARDMLDNEQAAGVHPGESMEEKLSLSDRFGLWLGFHRCDQETYLAMIDAYCEHFKLGKKKNMHREALLWATVRGSRSGRVAWQFIQDLAGKQKRNLNF